MPVPSTITDLSVLAATNSPAGTDSVTTAAGPDEYFRALAALLRREQAQAVAVASAATVDLGVIADGNYVHITGTTAITSFGTVSAGISRRVVFDGALVLTHNATSLILPNLANITTIAGDTAVFVSEGSGNWRCISYLRASGAQIGSAASGANTDITSLASPDLASATATTQASSDNSTKVATTAFVAAAQSTNDTRYAALAGLSTQQFNVANATTANNAVALGQFAGGNTTGYQKLPNGLIIQWARISTTIGSNLAAATYTNFPLAFPNAVLMATGNYESAGGSSYTIQVAPQSATQWYFTFNVPSGTTGNGAATNVNMIAIGY